MALVKYSRPPITEAVLEFQFEEAFGDRDLEKMRDRFARAYPSIELLQHIQVTFLEGKATTQSSLNGYKMTAASAIDVLLIQRNSLGTVRLSPYHQWETLRSRAEENFETLAKILGRRKIMRIGARYMNRFDVPSSEVEGKPLTTLLNVGVTLPENVAAEIANYAFTVEGREAVTGAKVRLQSAILPPALLEHVSISLDIDAYLDANIPGRMDEIWNCTELLREAKNSVFENSITDEMRNFIR
jgi:uncharacterized protein (TIGR04255 family)